MRNITYKYNVGDLVHFKEKFKGLTTCGLKDLTGKTFKVRDCRDYNGPAYKLEGLEGFYKESLFAGKSEEPEFDFYGCEDLVEGVEQYPEPKFDTESSVASEDTAKWVFHKDELFYTCSSCGRSALNDCFGQSTDSKFCPHCGKLMINSTMEED